ncbi:MAG: T9SS type A sorting domain-containing protein [Flavobacteriales bacterium]
MRLIILFSFFHFFQLSAQVINGSFVHNGITRNYITYLPPSYTTGSAMPLVFVLHGYTSNANDQMLYSQFNTVAAANNFIAVYPDGVNNAWNAGAGFGSTADDMGFLNALIDTLYTNYNINLDRVYSCGMSNGGFMSYRLACELSHRITAVASVTGSMSTGQYNNCNPTRTVPVMQIHGTADATVPYNGTLGITGIDNVMQLWAGKNTCPTTPTITNLPNVSTTDNCTVERHEFSPCSYGSQNVLLKVINGGHTWPGAVHIPSLGNTNQDISASEEIWIFFSQYTLSETTVVAEIDWSENVSIYPNPAIEVITIKGVPAFELVAVSFYSLDGKRVKQYTVTPQPEMQFTIRDLAKGVYLVEIISGNSVVNKKMIVE